MTGGILYLFSTFIIYLNYSKTSLDPSYFIYTLSPLDCLIAANNDALFIKAEYSNNCIFNCLLTGYINNKG